MVSKKRQSLEPRVLQLVHDVAEAIAPLGVDYAIGGALAMAAHGVRRYTSDVDVFAKDEDRPAIMRALRAQGLETATIMSPFHYIAYRPEHADPEVRIDVLFPAGEPELSAVEFADRGMVGDVELNVFPVDLLVASKFYSDRPEDGYDIKKMLNMGAFDPAAVEKLIASIDPEGAVDFGVVIATMLVPSKGRKRPERKR
jgi:hypothetical protein